MKSCLALVLSATLLLTSPASWAHKVIFDAFVSGDVIEGELGFSNGEMAVEQQVQVLTQTGQVLGQAYTDSDGFFVFKPSQQVDHYFVADLGAGHVAKLTVLANELNDNLPAPKVNDGAMASQSQANTVSTMSSNDLQKLTAQVKQMRKELSAYKEKNDLQTLLGGLGYILGLVGLGYYLAARRQLNQAKDQ